ncbi:hypothetical protein M758_8G014600 [Ceratodon purpureus]|nr:hypothetical protein M758_8G014600 [Ceratodon purpureus]
MEIKFKLTVTCEHIDKTSTFRGSQNPNSQHHGTTIWDSSIVFVKYLEKNSKKGEFSRATLHNERVLELGAGCGVVGS